MKPQRPSNMLVNVFIAIFALFAFFLLGGLFRALFSDSTNSDEFGQPDTELLNKEE